MTERAFLGAVVELAALTGWLAYHTHDSRRSQAGFPDLALVRAGRLILAELKAAKGRVRPAQAVWLDALGGVDGVEVYLWRPQDWPAIEAVLR